MPNMDLLTTNDRIHAPALPGDVGYDLEALCYVSIYPGFRATIPTGVSVELPDNTWGMIVPRSKSNQQGLMVLLGVIDTGYRGQLQVLVYNASRSRIHVAVGEKVAQLVLLPSIVPKIRIVDRLSDSVRACNGWGSTGK